MNCVRSLKDSSRETIDYSRKQHISLRKAKDSSRQTIDSRKKSTNTLKIINGSFQENHAMPEDIDRLLQQATDFLWKPMNSGERLHNPLRKAIDSSYSILTENFMGSCRKALNSFRKIDGYSYATQKCF